MSTPQLAAPAKPKTGVGAGHGGEEQVLFLRRSLEHSPADGQLDCCCNIAFTLIEQKKPCRSHEHGSSFEGLLA